MFNIKQSWFGVAVPQNCKGSTITIGAGQNGQVTVLSTGVIGEEANVFTMQVVAGSGASKALAAAFSNNLLTVTLGTAANGTLDNTKNTAKLVAEKIATVPGFTASYSGDGSTVIAITSQKAQAVLGDGTTPKKFVTVTYDTPGVAGNAMKIVVEDGVQNGALAAALADGVITVTLGMTNDAQPVPDDLKNTAALIAAQVDAIAGFSAVADGDGSLVPEIADSDEIAFTGGTTGILPMTGGQYGTECPDPDTIMRNFNNNTNVWDYYTVIAPNGKYDANWRMFNLTNF